MKKILFSIAVISSMISCKEKLTPVCDGSTPTYEVEVEAILMQNCSSSSSCHGTGANNHRGVLTTYAHFKEIIDDGTFEKKVLTNQSMPKGSVLTQEEINTLQCWIDSGAKEN